MMQPTAIRLPIFTPNPATPNPVVSRGMPASAACFAGQFDAYALTRHFEQDRRHVWVILLATGAGSQLRRLATLTRKSMQLCSLRDGSSALEQTRCLAQQIAPLEHIFAIVTTEHEVWWHAPLSVLPKGNVLTQPENRGTAVGILSPLLHIYQRDPLAQVVLLPSDRPVGDETALVQALERALRLLDQPDNEVLLLGNTSEGPIEPARVARVVAKASLDKILALVDRGALWNAFTVVARARPLLNLLARLPSVIRHRQRPAIAHVVVHT